MDCTASRADGSGPCGRPAIRGGTVCPSHGGSAPAVRRNAWVRSMVLDWKNTGLAEVDPYDQFARMLSVTAFKQARLARLIQIAASGDETADTWPDDYRREILSYVGVRTKEDGSKEEYLRVLVQAEARERERLADWSLKAISAGLDERKVRILEAQAAAMVGVLDKIADRMGLSAADRDRFEQIAAEVLDPVPPNALAGPVTVNGG